MLDTSTRARMREAHRRRARRSRVGDVVTSLRHGASDQARKCEHSQRIVATTVASHLCRLSHIARPSRSKVSTLPDSERRLSDDAERSNALPGADNRQWPNKFDARFCLLLFSHMNSYKFYYVRLSPKVLH
jgi:hypothetical protein